MKSVDVQCSFFVGDVENHEKIKPFILDCIAMMGQYSYNNEGGRISNTDWHLSSNYTRHYADIAFAVFKEHNEKLAKLMQFNQIQTGNFWFQQYHKGDWHDWHNHESFMFSNVYYVELEGSPKTTFRYLGKEFEVEVKEGQILTFPSVFTHCSKENKSDNIKTIISFNSNGYQ